MIESMTKSPKILLLDIETAPKVAYVWKFWKEHVSPDKVISDGYIMSVSWRWFGEEAVHAIDGRHSEGYDYLLAYTLRNLLDACDVAIAHNAKKFDLPLLNARCLIHGILPPSPYQIIDTLDVARKKFRFDNNSLGYLSRLLGCEAKSDHKKFPGFTLWSECMSGNQDAWDEMVEYNKQDVVVLCDVYNKLRPWIDNHPNVANMPSKVFAHTCPKCGSHEVQKRGVYNTAVSVFQRYRCNSCGGWGRSRENLRLGSERKNLLTNARVF